MRTFLTTFFCFVLLIGIVQADSGKFIFVKGGVEVVTADGKLKLIPQKGSILKSDYVISTKEDGVAILRLVDSSVVKIDPNSIVEIENLVSMQKTKKRGQTSFILRAGGIMSKAIRQKSWIRSDDDPPLEIKYKNTAIGIRGTKFYVGIDQDDENLWTVVKEGRVRVVNYVDDDYEDVKFGESIFIEKGNTLSRPGRFSWPLHLNWAMKPLKNARLQSNFYSIGKRRDIEYQKKRSELLKRKRKSYKKIGPNRIQRLKKRKFNSSKRFFKSRKQSKARIKNIRKNYRKGHREWINKQRPAKKNSLRRQSRSKNKRGRRSR